MKRKEHAVGDGEGMCAERGLERAREARWESAAMGSCGSRRLCKENARWMVEERPCRRSGREE